MNLLIWFDFCFFKSKWMRVWGVPLIPMLGVLLAGCFWRGDSVPADIGGYNYTDYYIDKFYISNEGQSHGAMGRNILPKDEGEERSGGWGGMCCIGIPSRWRPDMKLVIQWNVDKILDGKHLGVWYRATTVVPPYGSKTAGFNVHFLPDDRIRVEVGGMSGPLDRIDAQDPYIVQGVLDEVLNAKENKERGE